MHPLALFALGFLLCGTFSWAAIRWLAPLGWMDMPAMRKTHGQPIPRSGGMALWAVLAMGQGFGWLQLPMTTSEWLCLHGLALMGALDDRFSLRASLKAYAGLVLAVLLAIPLSQAIHSDRPVAVLLSIPIPTDPPWIIFALLVFWFWALPQSFNLIDGMNGLAIGQALITLLALRIGLRSGQGTYLLGALLAALALNWPRARQFLGDCGAYFLGGLLGLLALKTKAFAYPSHALWLFAYPILDTSLVILTRLLLRRPLGQGDRNHFHHHWERWLGRHAAWAVPILWLHGAMLAARTLYFPGSELLAWTALGAMALEGAFFLFRAQQGK